MGCAEIGTNHSQIEYCHCMHKYTGDAGNNAKHLLSGVPFDDGRQQHHLPCNEAGQISHLLQCSQQYAPDDSTEPAKLWAWSIYMCTVQVVGWAVFQRIIRPCLSRSHHGCMVSYQYLAWLSEVLHLEIVNCACLYIFQMHLVALQLDTVPVQAMLCCLLARQNLLILTGSV